MYNLKTKHLGHGFGNSELKGKELLKNYLFKLEAQGIESKGLNLVRDILSYMQMLGTNFFASIVFSKEELDLSCANVNQLERPFFFLFERIDLFMKENYPGLMATLVFDDRGLQFNTKISKSVHNFFHKSRTGQSFDSIIKSPVFALSSDNVGLQMADLGAYILGSRFTGDKKRIEFFKKMKELQFVSRTLVNINGVQLPTRGFKVIRKKEAGDFHQSGKD